MKGFIRKNQLFSLCGLNCGLCPMLLGGHCGAAMETSPALSPDAAWSRAHRNTAATARAIPVKSTPILTSLIHLSPTRDAGRIWREQEEKIQILDALLSQCNDGRRKTLFCVAVNLLEVTELREAMEAIHTAAGFQDWPLKERAAYAVGILQEIAHRRNLSLKLHRKK